MRVSRIHRHQRTHMSSSKFCIVCFKGDCDLQLEENCEHYFHSACIRKWVSSNGKTCPACFQHIRAAKDVTTPEMKLNRCCFFVALFLAYILVVSWASTFGVAKTNATVIFTPSTGKDVMLYDSELIKLRGICFARSTCESYFVWPRFQSRFVIDAVCKSRTSCNLHLAPLV